MNAARMKDWRMWSVLFGLMLTLVVVNRGIAQREETLRSGRILLLALAPTDPRSMMQGDYMALRYAAEEQIRNALRPQCAKAGTAAALACYDGLGRKRCPDGGCGNGYVIFLRDANAVGRFVRTQTTASPRKPDEIAVRFRERDAWAVRIAGNAWFFPEGQAECFVTARYGELRVADDGTALLTGLRDAKRKPLTARSDLCP